jgi:hypothetical protein
MYVILKGNKRLGGQRKLFLTYQLRERVQVTYLTSKPYQQKQKLESMQIALLEGIA